ncbi:sulfatase-like hydrolase/transferase [Cohnella zeiphila]|uniref:Sulfatase-like hydrolase/transferase n=1 Tax=Cohnella zeiphila TaxID=2761120 RepID=A0A7X0SJQ6_9BACL|nr:sulfatase-like hydrolase/transferase [Cohnella zeiphila]
MQPNIVLIQTDQQSAETLALYGNPLVRTPHLDQLAKQGVLFEKAFCNYPACSPSRSSMMTGRYASTIRVHANHMLIDPREISLPQVLREGGYQTALIGKNHAFPKETLHQVFDHAVQGEHGHLVDGHRDDPEAKAAHQWAVDHCWRSPLGHGTNPAPYEKCGTYLLGQSAADYMEQARQPEKPFFMWLSFPDPHTPYQTPEPYASMYSPEDVPMPPYDDLKTKPERQRVMHAMDAMDRADEQTIRSVRAIHYGMISFIDDAIGRVMAKLEELGLSDNTVILFTSDHGDSMGAHGLIQKHNAFYDTFTHVPLIMAWPGKSLAGIRSPHPIELVDIMPTILDLAECPIPYGVQGRSCASYLLGQSYEPREFVVIESGEEGEPIRMEEIGKRPSDPFDESCFVWCAYRDAWYGKGKSIRTAEWKLNLYTNGDGELYRLTEDPHELTNEYGNPEWESVVIELERKLLRWSLANEDRLPVNDTVKLNYRQQAT